VFGLDRRVEQDELMDTVRLSPASADRTLRFLELTNRRFGGAAVVVRRLSQWIDRWPADRPVTVLDVGTGAADIPRALVGWARSHGRPMRVTAIDMAPDIAAVARDRVRGTPEIVVQQATLADVAASDRRFDYVIASLFLHHVPDDRLSATLVAMDRLASRGIVIGDLVRSRAALLAVGLLSAVAGNAIVRHDGPLSVRRALTVRELSNLAGALGLGYLRARPEGPFRLSLAGEKVANA
jgi:2-polyprenyl-3-methyl-5-hydroxy-6-metoxy-1,4-benzoquinol methylase